MRTVILCYLLLISACVSLKDGRSHLFYDLPPFWELPPSDYTKTYGFILNPIAPLPPPPDFTGIQIEASPILAILLINAASGIPRTEFKTEHNPDEIHTIRGMFLGLFYMGEYKAFGLDLSVTGGFEPKTVHGWSLSMFGQDHIELKGLATAILYNRGVRCRGVQVSFLYNRCDDFRGVQLGFMNKNQKRAMPFINIVF